MKTPEEIISDLNVSVYYEPGLEYPDEVPYSPNIRYPEYFFKDTMSKKNGVYDAVRQSFHLLHMDENNFATPQWNPFRELIEHGNTVIIKPNFVLSNHDEGGDLFSVITHPSVLRAVIDYVYIALAGKGRIIIADAPQMDCNFNELLRKTGLECIKELYKKELNFNIEIYDLRDFWLDKSGGHGVANSGNRHKLQGDPWGGVLVNLGKESLFCGINNFRKFYGADYNREETIRHHHDNVQEYLISKTILSADVVISVPKLKVHKKVGVTLNIKGLVGINLNKNYLIHYRLGTPSDGGDQFPNECLTSKEVLRVKLQRLAYDKFLAKKNWVGDSLFNIALRLGRLLLKPLGIKLNKDKAILDAGNWYGNDSAWRMAVDLMRIFIYANKDGKLQHVPARRVFAIVDGVVGGERNGPLSPDSKKSCVLIAGFNSSIVDLVCARLMGFDYKKIRMLKYVVDHPEFFRTDLSKINLLSNVDFDALFDEKNKNKYLDFEPHFGWKGHIEIN